MDARALVTAGHEWGCAPQAAVHAKNIPVLNAQRKYLQEALRVIEQLHLSAGLNSEAFRLQTAMLPVISDAPCRRTSQEEHTMTPLDPLHQDMRTPSLGTSPLTIHIFGCYPTAVWWRGGGGQNNSSTVASYPPTAVGYPPTAVGCPKHLFPSVPFTPQTQVGVMFALSVCVHCLALSQYGIVFSVCFRGSARPALENNDAQSIQPVGCMASMQLQLLFLRLLLFVISFNPLTPPPDWKLVCIPTIAKCEAYGPQIQKV